jgi:hypothetical protein
MRVACPVHLIFDFGNPGVKIKKLLIMQFSTVPITSSPLDPYTILSILSRPALGSIQSAIQWVPGALSSGVKRQSREADHTPPSSAEVINERAILPLSIFLHGMVLNCIMKCRHKFPFTFSSNSSVYVLLFMWIYVSYPYKIPGKITVVHILIFALSDNKRKNKRF